jgi:hypothetical protein
MEKNDEEAQAALDEVIADKEDAVRLISQTSNHYPQILYTSTLRP